MQESIIFPPPVKSSNARFFGFNSSFDSALKWDGAIPPVTLTASIESVAEEPDAYERYLAIGYSLHDQISSVFSNDTTSVRSEVESLISSAADAGSFNQLEIALKKKAFIVKLVQRITWSKAWSGADHFFGVDALSLDRTDFAYFFTSLDTLEHEEERLGIYEGFLLHLTSTHFKRILVKAVSILEDASLSIDAEIHSALARGETANNFNLSLNQPVEVVTVAGAATLNSTNGWGFEVAIHRSLQLLAGLGEAVLSRAMAVGLGTLLYSPALGNGERYPQTALKLSGSKLLPDATTNLNEIASAGGTIDLPYRIYGDPGQYTLVATPNGGRISPAVPVRALVFDRNTSSYSFASHDTPPITLGFPVIHQGGSSTTSPVRPADIPSYTGVELTPLLVQPETLPAFESPDFRDCIYCFPIESGLPPIYVVFNSPYEGASTRGKYSGRLYNPAKAGGPILDLDWTSAKVTQAGIDLVKLHTGRFDPSDGNAIMIERLEKILQGKLIVTAIDKRFYTHELRELERFRAVGVADGVNPKDEGAVWNNTHAATLEDYKLKDVAELLYTPDAIAADKQQREREYKQLGVMK
ncbi:hypothetical protein PS918_00363 [Pseudomonas fluorescens]|uniref:Pyosin/cloacin translocation domain-containing protein n=1 Tax=Pseudomonas fluorescens TaxID=294 RepID=A0A5E7QY35_PSEFL|nr:S-type pyocin domain-containing protein [Pseudomonas fluorescens]VVP66385.1 hypothetical protein PS918_00363 [Pseudomonas fluorescens]